MPNKQIFINLNVIMCILLSLVSISTLAADVYSKSNTTIIKPVTIPTGYGFPGKRKTIQTWADKWNIKKITAKAWDLWGGMTANSGQTWQGSILPVWETWCGTTETFSQQCNILSAPSRDFVNASQLTHNQTQPQHISDLRLAAFNKFNPAMANYLALSHSEPNSSSYNYTKSGSLATLNAAWPKATPIAERKVQDTPYISPNRTGSTAAIETKPVLFLVKQNQLTPVPLWQGPDYPAHTTDKKCKGVVNAGSPNADKCHPQPSTWKKCVLVDPKITKAAKSLKPATKRQISSAAKDASLSCNTYFYAPIGNIYAFAMDSSQAVAYNKVQGGNGLSAKAGDYAVLTAMHINTKEIINWTWQTFWWQPGKRDTPYSYPGSKKGMTNKVKGVWRNYAACTAYNQTQGIKSTKIHVCFNPFLETSPGIPDGLQSNCMSCHGTATVGSTISSNPPKVNSLSYPASYKTPIDFNNGEIFKDYTRTDFSWAIPVNAN